MTPSRARRPRRYSIVRGAALAMWSASLSLAILGCGEPAVAPPVPPGQGSAAAEATPPIVAPAGTATTVVAAPAAGPIEAFRQAAEGVYSGGEPKTRDAFAKLKSIGVKTIVSVDGQQPNVELAHEFGMTYVHIPLGYDGVPPEAQRALTEVMNTSVRPLFIHCHHGKHRGPAAVAIACRAAGLLDAAGAKQLLEAAGTSRDYQGLWHDVEAYQRSAPDAPRPMLVERAEVSAMQSAMAMLDRAFDRLKLAQKAGWKTGAGPSDPQAAALLVVESFTESLRDASNDELQQRLTEAKALAEELQAAIGKGEVEEQNAAMQKLDASCKACHKAYRD